MRIKGKIISWNDDKGFGFIAPFWGSKQVFIHIKAFGNRNRRPAVNDIVTFSPSMDRRGRPCAAKATLVGVAYAALSLITYFVYYSDKSAARSGGGRTPENTLHLLGLAGGWPGALLAQQTLRHKSKKESFRATLWVTVLINCGAFIWLLTDQGRAALGLLS
jgi:uncharacterized membrane protein YsdA (DUF1294 family)